MSFSFNAEEVFEMARQIERNGARFYRQAAQKISEPDARERLLKLADMEDGHELIFINLQKKLLPGEQEKTVFDPYGEAALYLQALANNRVFDLNTEVEERLKGKENLDQVLQEALKFEKESVVFYLGMKEMVPESFGKDKIDLLIKEEMSHIAMLGKELARLNPNN